MSPKRGLVRAWAPTVPKQKSHLESSGQEKKADLTGLSRENKWSEIAVLVSSQMPYSTEHALRS